MYQMRARAGSRQSDRAIHALRLDLIGHFEAPLACGGDRVLPQCTRHTA